MAYVDPATLADGAVVSAARWNQDVVNNTIFLHSPPYARLSNTSTQNLSAATTEIAEFNTADDDNDGMADLANNRLVIQTAGMYVVTARVYLADSTGSGEKYLQLVSSSGVIIASRSVDHDATITRHTVTGQNLFAVGESVTLQVYLSAGTGIQLTSNQSYLAAHWLRGALS